MLKLHSHDVITNCRVKVCTNDLKYDTFTHTTGVVVPGQLLAIPLIENGNKIKITIDYDTIMKEAITHTLDFENGIKNQSVEKGEKIVVKQSNVKNPTTKIIIESNSILFEYVEKG